jgi:hypothetical protein
VGGGTSRGAAWSPGSDDQTLRVWDLESGERLPLEDHAVLCGLGNTKFDEGLGWNLDLLLRLWIKAHARLSLLLHQLAETGQDKFTVLFTLLVGERDERIDEYSSGSFVNWVASASAV